jgi:glycerol kinase
VTAPRHLLALDQGTTSSRAIVFDLAGAIKGVGQIELPQIYPAPGWVEHDPERLFADSIAAARQALAAAGLEARDIAAIGITNQRETTVLWERSTGRPLHNAIVWQDRRTAPLCEKLRRDGHEDLVGKRTGLLLDPYFSATKLAWLLDHVPGVRERARRGELAAGTVDSWLLWRLTGGRVHATDATNAARTMLFDIHRQRWDDDLLALFDIPATLLPEVRDSAADFGWTAPDLLGAALPVRGIAGDQQAATFGQAAFEPGMGKATYGTGCFALVNTGDKPVASRNRLLTTVAWRLQGKVTYALEGAIFIAGAAVQWLRDGLGLVGHAAETEELAAAVADTGGVYLVPAFAGLGAPYWDAEARGALIGLTRASGRHEIARACLEAIGYQTRDLIAAMTADGMAEPARLRVDGGLTANGFAMQFLADQLDVAVERPIVTETTALGAAFLAGIGIGAIDGPAAAAAAWTLDRAFKPAMAADRREVLYAGWRDAVARVRSH